MMTPQAVLKFWFEEAGPDDWFKKSDAFDAAIRQRFEPAAIEAAALAGRKSHPWEATPEGALALVILLDQFSRNMYRDTPAAFAWDATAKRVTLDAVDRGDDLKLSQPQRRFLYMPLMHSEELSDQKRCVELIDQRLDNEDTLHHARAHQKLIEQYGRFPHRNEILGRASTIEEINFLKNGGYAP